MARVMSSLLLLTFLATAAASRAGASKTHFTHLIPYTWHVVTYPLLLVVVRNRALLSLVQSVHSFRLVSIATRQEQEGNGDQNGAVGSYVVGQTCHLPAAGPFQDDGVKGRILLQLGAAAGASFGEL